MDADEFLWISDVKRPKRDNPSSYDQAGHTEKESVEWAIVVATVERTMKKYADNLLHVLEGMSGRLSQLEFNSQRIEHTVQEFKVESADNHGAADGKLRSLENMIREVILSSCYAFLWQIIARLFLERQPSKSNHVHIAHTFWSQFLTSRFNAGPLEENGHLPRAPLNKYPE
jgi:hypothetical protein